MCMARRWLMPRPCLTKHLWRQVFSANDRNLLFGSRRESLKPGSISRLRASCQQLDSESDEEKQPPFITLAGDYPIRWSYDNFSQSSWNSRGWFDWFDSHRSPHGPQSGHARKTALLRKEL